MKVCTIVGARPQFIKAAMVSRILRQQAEEVLIHTGQHFDQNMSEVFFNELSIPKPDFNLGVSGGTHAGMTARMLIAIEEVLLKVKPDKVLLYGDTNSTLAGALVAVKLHIPVYHVESGTRLGTLTNPEEVNRICTDHVSTVLMACTASSMGFLKNEGLINRSYLVGDPMYDAFLYYSGVVQNKASLKLQSIDGKEVPVPRDFYYMTCHREENTGTNASLMEILQAMNSLDVPIVYPVHPRTRRLISEIREKERMDNILFVNPVGYLESLWLVKNARRIVTDSGGLQREAFFAEKPCVTILNFVCWPETMVDNRNQLAKPNKQDILAKLTAEQYINPTYRPFGDGNAGQRIVNLLVQGNF